MASGTPGDPTTMTSLGPATPSQCAPVIDNFAISQYLPNRQVVVVGHVQDPNTGCSVTLSGVGSGTASCDANGNFQATLNVSQLGQIQAIAYDFVGTPSAAATVTVTNQPPVIQNFQAVQGANHTWTLSGSVGDEAPAGLTVALTSAMPDLRSINVAVNSNGCFSVTVQLNSPGDSGTVYANCIDWWGVASPTASATVQPV